MNNIQALFKPFHSKNLTLPNRFVMAPMTRAESPGNIPNEINLNYYKARAAGGVGLIISEGTYINPYAAEGAFSNPEKVPHFYGNEALQGWKTIVDAVHQAGGKFIPQLWHVGSVRQTGIAPTPEKPGYGPSAVIHPHAAKSELPIVMTEKDIESTINDYVVAACNAKKIGCDGIELHGAHGYLLDQFFWDYTNRREDVYGGTSIAERTRFASDLIKAIRNAIGPDFPIVLRYSQWKLSAYDAKLAHNPQELESFLLPLVDAGVDVFHCSTRRIMNPEFENSNLNLAGWTKKITGKTVITVGSVGLDLDFIKTYQGEKSGNIINYQSTIEDIAQRIEKGEFDLVAVGRSLIADAKLVNKIKANDYDHIIKYDAGMLGQYPNIAD